MKLFIFLSLNDVIHLHARIMERFGGGGYLIRDRALLESAVEHPKLTLFNEFIYKNVFQIAAAYFFHITKNHPFVDGNKRTGLLVALTFLEKNGYRLKVNNDELYSLAIKVAESKITKKQLTVFFENHTQMISQ